MGLGQQHKDQVRELVAPGWPAVEKDLPSILTWLEDPNCTGFPIAAEFLRGVGPALAPRFKEILRKPPDDITPRVLELIDDWPRDAVGLLQEELLTLARGFDMEDCHLSALSLLAEHGFGNREQLRRIVKNKKSALNSWLSELGEVEELLDGGSTP